MQHNRNVSRAIIRLLLRTTTAGMFLLAAGLLASHYREPFRWEATLGTVERVAIVRSGDPEDSRAPGERFEIDVLYRFEVAGETLTASTISRRAWIYPNRERAAAYASRHGIEAGARIPVYFDPDDPAQSVLVRDIPWHRLEVWLATLFLLVIPLIVVGISVRDVLRGIRGGSNGEMPPGNSSFF